MSDADEALDAMKAQKVLAVCIPAHDGKIHWQTVFQLREEEQLFRLLKLDWRIEPIVQAGCSLITRARNEAVEHALERGAEAIMWIDNDMNWESGAIARLLHMNMDVVGAGVPLKQAAIKWNISWLDNRDRGEKGLIEVKTIGTGFLFTRKRVYEIMKERTPQTGENVYERAEGKGLAFAYFQAPGSWGEDTFFCHRWRQLGGKVYVDPAITMEHVIAPMWSVKANLGAWLADQYGPGEDKPLLTRALMTLRQGLADQYTFRDIYEGWGNGVYAATPDLLAALYDLARQAKGPILECGTGISTLVMALANPDVEIHALEHDPSWYMRLSRLLAEYEIGNVTLHIADMHDYPEGKFYALDGLPSRFDLVVLDGPPRHIGNRAVAYRVLAPMMEGAILAVDDTNDPREAEALKAFLKTRPGECAVYNNNAKQFSLFFPEAREEAA